MTLYALLVCFHVVVAILGLGQITAMLVLARATVEPISPMMWATFSRLLRGTSVSLGLMMLSGILIEYVAHGAFHGAWWFRISFLLALIAGAINGTTNRALRKRVLSDAQLLGRIRSGAWAMATAVAVVAILMESKPI